MTTVPPQSTMPSIVEGAFRDSLPLLRSRLTVYGILAILCAIGGVVVPFVHGTDKMPTELLRLQIAVQSPNLCGAIAIFFIFPAVVRTVRPEFRMTVGRFFALIGIGLVVEICTAIAGLFLALPGLWIAVKWSQVYWTYLLGEGENPFAESWRITTGQFWETLGFLILLGIAVAIPVAVVFLGAGAVAAFVPALAIALMPVAFFGYVFALHASLLGQMRWMLRLRGRQVQSAVPTPA